MWNMNNPMGPYMMAQPQSSPQVVYVPMPMPTGPGMPPMPPSTGIPVKQKPMSAKRMQKIAEKWTELAAKKAAAGGKKEEDKKDKKLTEKMFSFFETCLLLIVTSIPIGLTMLFMLKTAMSIARSILAM